MVSAILVITSVFLGVFSGVLCLRLKELLPSKSKAPRVYLFILVLTLVLQFVTYVLIVTNFLLLLFFPKHKRITFLSIVNGSIIQLIPILLLICTLIALQARLLALKESRPLASRTRFRIANYGNNILCLLLVLSWVLVSIQDRAVPDALNGKHTQHTEPPGDGGRERSDQKNTLDLGRLGQLAYAVIFACLTYSIMIHARKVNVYLLLPDQVLLVINTRIAPLFLFRSSYLLIDAVLPLLVKDPRIRLFSPSVAISIDGVICVLVSHTLLGLANPPENWMEREVAHLVPAIDSSLVRQQHHHADDIENGARVVVVQDASPNAVSSEQQRKVNGKPPSGWSRLLSPFGKQQSYGATKNTGRREEAVISNEGSAHPSPNPQEMN